MAPHAQSSAANDASPKITLGTPATRSYLGDDTLGWPLLLYLLLHLFLHHHHLHMLSSWLADPRRFVLVPAITAGLCVGYITSLGRRWASRERPLAASIRLAAAIVPALLGFLWAFGDAILEMRWVDVLLIGQPRLLHGWLVWSGAVEERTFEQRLHALLFRSAEAAYYICALPALFARHEPVVPERTESLRIFVVVLANVTVLSLLQLLGDPTLTADDDIFGVFGATARLAEPPATAGRRPSHEGVKSSKLKQGSKLSRGAGGAAAFVKSPSPKELAQRRAQDVRSSLLVLRYCGSADRLHVALLYAQSALVVALLLGFLYTHHWRSHAATLVCNYVLLLECTRFRISWAAKQPARDAAFQRGSLRALAMASEASAEERAVVDAALGLAKYK